MSDDSLKNLLETVTSDSAEGGEFYNYLRNSLCRYFQIKGDFDPDAAADATLDRVGTKLAQNTKIDDLTKYSFGVARLIFYERLRAAEKNRVAHDGFYAERKSDEVADYSFYRECFDKLNKEEKEMLKDYFADLRFSELTVYREKLTVKYNISLNNIRLKVFRLRKRLDECLKRKLV